MVNQQNFIMIHKDTTFGGVPVYAHVEFGTGDIAVMDGSGKTDQGTPYVTVMFKNIDPGPVGAYLPEGPGRDCMGKPITSFPPEIVLTFDNPLSIDVVIRRLQLAKANLSK